MKRAAARQKRSGASTPQPRSATDRMDPVLQVTPGTSSVAPPVSASAPAAASAVLAAATTRPQRTLASAPPTPLDGAVLQRVQQMREHFVLWRGVGGFKVDERAQTAAAGKLTAGHAGDQGDIIGALLDAGLLNRE